MSDKNKDEVEISDKKEDLKKIIGETTDSADRIVENTDVVKVTFARVSDLGKIVEPLVDDGVDDEDVEKHYGFWSGIQEATFKVEAEVTKLVESTGIPSSTSGTVYAYTHSINPEINLIDLSNSPLPVITAVGQFNQFAQNPELADEVRDLLTGLGMDQARKGKVSPLNLFNHAFDAYEGNNPAVQTLIPMRSSIDECITILLMQRPTQARAGSWDAKIRSILGQLAYSSVLPITIDTLASDLDDLLDHLSPGKKDEIDRPDLTDRIYEAILFYHSLLDSIDKSKLRNPPQPAR